MPSIATILPSRGLVFAKTIEGIIRNSAQMTAGFFIMIDESGNGYPMPDCFNKGIIAALNTQCTHILLVEEDNEVPNGIVEKMLEINKPIVALEYAMGKGTSVTRKGNKIVSTGIGCCLFQRAVFEAIKYPWFEVDKVIDAKTDEISVLPKHQVAKKYGGHDPLFFRKALEKGYEITVVPEKIGRHFRAKEIEKIERNEGCYTIYSL